jgi:hypothetical protein
VVNSGVNQVWRKREANGDYVVALFNTGTSGNSTVSVSWSQVGFSGSADVTDLWSGSHVGTVTGSYSATLRPGETRLIRARPGTSTGGRYEAENAAYSAGSTVDSNHAGFSGTGFVNTPNEAGAYVEWAVNAASAGNGTVRLHYANGQAGGQTVDRPMDVAVNGTVVTAGRSFPGTANWDTWADVTLTVPLRAGANTVRVTATTANGAPNLDYLDIGATS